MSLAFVSRNLKAAAWPFLYLKNLPVCQDLEGIKELTCFLKIEACVHMCVYMCKDFPLEWKKAKKQHSENVLELLQKISPYSSEWELFI